MLDATGAKGPPEVTSSESRFWWSNCSGPHPVGSIPRGKDSAGYTLNALSPSHEKSSCVTLEFPMFQLMFMTAVLCSRRSGSVRLAPSLGSCRWQWGSPHSFLSCRKNKSSSRNTAHASHSQPHPALLTSSEVDAGHFLHAWSRPQHRPQVAASSRASSPCLAFPSPAHFPIPHSWSHKSARLGVCILSEAGIQAACSDLT